MRITERHLFGLESMRDKISSLLLDETMSDEEYGRLVGLREECEQLLGKIHRGSLTQRKYERVVEITLDREAMRFQACIDAGMGYEEAAPALRGE